MYLLSFEMSLLKAFSHAYILMTRIPEITSFMMRTRWSVTSADLNLIGSQLLFRDSLCTLDPINLTWSMQKSYQGKFEEEWSKRQTLQSIERSSRAPGRQGKWPHPSGGGQARIRGQRGMPIGYNKSYNHKRKEGEEISLRVSYPQLLTSSNRWTSFDARLTMCPIESLPMVTWLSDNIWKPGKESKINHLTKNSA